MAEKFQCATLAHPHEALMAKIEVAGTSPPMTLMTGNAARAASVRPAQTLLPELDNTGREFTYFDARAPAGFRPHVEQDLIPAQALDWASLIAFKGRVKFCCHPEKFKQRRDVLFGALLCFAHCRPGFLSREHGNPLVLVWRLPGASVAAVLGVTKERIDCVDHHKKAHLM